MEAIVGFVKVNFGYDNMSGGVLEPNCDDTMDQSAHGETIVAME